jgi:hypothetical protein
MRHIENLLLKLRWGLVGHAWPPPLLRLQAFGAMLLVGLFDLVEVSAADARSLAGRLDIAQFLGQLQQPDAGFDKLLFVAHEWCPFGGDLPSGSFTSYTSPRS